MLRKVFKVLSIICVFYGLSYAQFPPRHVALGDWMMLHGSLGHNGFGALKGQITSWSVKYTLSLCSGESQPAVADINADGLPELVFNCYGSTTVYAVRGTNGTILWTSGVSGGSWGAPAIADVLPSTPGLEVIVCSSTSTALLNGQTGATIWTAPYGCGSSAGAPAVAYDGADTLILVNNNTTLYALRASTGAVVWSAATGGATLIGIAKSPAVGDINGDTALDVVVAGNGTVYAYRFTDGTLLWTRTISTRYYTRTPATLVDLTGDCIDEILVSDDGGNIYALNGVDGSSLWTYNISGQMACGPISTADVNGDGINDVIVGTLGSCNCGSPGRTVVINGATGTLIWQQTFDGPNMTHGGGRVVSDFDSDGQLEIAVVPYYSASMCFGDGIFRMFNALTGTIEWTAGGIVGEGSSFADIDGDGCSEIMVLPSAGTTTLIVVDDNTAVSCGFYPYNDTCGVLSYDDPVNVAEKVSIKRVDVSSGKGHIEVSTNFPAMVKIYTTNGRLIGEFKVSGEGTFRIKKGVYLVNVEGKLYTVVVR